MINDVRRFMDACDQEVSLKSVRQMALYTGLQCEELAEKLFAILGPECGIALQLDQLGVMFKKGQLDVFVGSADQVDLLDADLDQVWVSIGAAISLGADVGLGWDILTKNNMTKISPETGKAMRDENGKIKKPEGFTPPDFGPAFVISAK